VSIRATVLPSTVPGTPQRGAILVVDDDRDKVAALTALVAPLEHPVVCATSRREALERLASEPVALILLSAQVTGLDSFETLVAIRAEARWCQIPVVFVTAIGTPAEVEASVRGYALGALDYVSMPVDSGVFVAKLRALMSWHERSEQLRREAEQVARERATREERERVLGVVSHDLRSPLATIQIGSDYLLARGGLDADQAKVARRIQRNAERMARLIEDLLDFTRVQSGTLAIRPTRSCVADLVVESVEDLQASSSRQIEVAVETRRAHAVDGDRLAQVVTNLVRNAVEHSHAPARIAVKLLEHDGVLELSVWNEGEIAAPDPHALFEPFRKGSDSGGMGLGLYISQQIARAHGGDITVSSSPRAGTTFCLRLPARAEPG
jgi:two-component system, sensor histidine kinase and response regulator